MSERSCTREKKKAKIQNEQSSFTDTPDQVFDQMLSTSFLSEEKLARFLNGKDKMGFIRRYTDLLDRMSYWKLKQAHWDYYLHIGQTQNIWTNRVPKLLAEKNSMAHAYGRSKSMIERRRIQIEQKSEQVQNAIAQFEHQTLSQSVPDIDYSSELNSLSSIVRTFVQENQQQLRSELEYKRKMLVLDATDHRLVQAFFDLKPKKGQVSVLADSFLLFESNPEYTCPCLRFIPPGVSGERQRSKSWWKKKWLVWNVVCQPGHCNLRRRCLIE